MVKEVYHYQNARILIADDQESIVALVSRTLEKTFGCEVAIVSSGDEAMARLAEETFDVFLTDMRMPGIHGLNLIEQVTARWPEIHVVAMTGYPSEFPYVEVVEAGAKDFLNKPFLAAELIAKLMRVLDERRMRHELEVTHKKYRSLFDLSMDGKVLLALEGLVIEDANDAICTLLGKSKGELMGTDFVELLVEADRERFNLWMGICQRSGKGTIGDLQIIRSNGMGIHVDATVTMVGADGEDFIFLAFRDMTEKREVEHRLAEAAQTDELTGLYNKRSFMNRIELAVASADESESRLALLMIDLDNFKQCNDNHGHQVGDELLKAVGEVITASIRTPAYDEGFRCGGDEFAVLLHKFIDDGPMVVAERMREKFEQIENYGTSMSIGVAEYRPSMNVASLIRAADDALYDAKGQGKNAVCVAS